MNTRFGLVFVDMLEGLVAAFPRCRHTKKIHQWVEKNPEQLNAVKLDWARMIAPYKIRSFEQPIDYFEKIHKELPSHLFSLLELPKKFKSMANDKVAQDDLHGVLVDLETFSLFDDNAVGVVEEPNTPTSDIDMKNNDPQVENIFGNDQKNRFDDPALFDLCVAKTGDIAYCTQLRDLACKLPVLSEMFGKETNEAIANQMVKMQQFLPSILQMFSMLPLEQLPLQNIISMVAQQTMGLQRGRDDESVSVSNAKMNK